MRLKLSFFKNNYSLIPLSIVAIATTVFYIKNIKGTESETTDATCKKEHVVSSKIRSARAIEPSTKPRNIKENSPREYETNLNQLEAQYDSQLENALQTELSIEQMEVFAEVPDDFVFLELADNVHLATDVVSRITNLDSTSETRNYLISLLRGLPLKEKEEAIEFLSHSDREEDRLVAIEFLSSVGVHVKSKILKKMLTERLPETLLSEIVAFSKNDTNEQIMPLVSDVISNRFFDEQNETKKLQLLSMISSPNNFKEAAFSHVLKALISNNSKNVLLGFNIAQKWVSSNEENLTSIQLNLLLDNAKWVLNNTSLPIEQRLASLRFVEALQDT